MEKLALTPHEVQKLSKPNNLIPVMTHMESDFFRDWCVFLNPFVHLTPREMDVLACFLKYRWQLSKSILDPSVVDTMLMTDNIRDKIMKECGISMQNFYVVMNSLRKKKVFVNNVLEPRLIPNIRKDNAGYFQLLILFKEKA